MDVLYPHVCGIDVHAKFLVACCRHVGPSGSVRSQSRRVGTVTAELEALASWLTEEGITHVAMESTGVLWQPVWNVLEERFVVVLVNPRDVHYVTGRKTDTTDAAWLAQLLHHGLLRASFVPPRAIRELRDRTRGRATLVDQTTAVANRIHAVLHDANLGQLAFLEDQIAVYDAQITEATRPFAASLARLDSMPGGNQRTAENILAELGDDMTVFATAAHAASWVAICPGNHETGGKRRSGTTRHGNHWARRAFTEAAWAAKHTRGTYAAAQFRQIAARRGPKRAIVAVAHGLLIATYHILRDGATYQELGAEHFDRFTHTQHALCGEAPRAPWLRRYARPRRVRIFAESS